MKALALSISLFLSACVYTETPYGRAAVLDLPVHSQTTVNKTVTINAPARDDRHPIKTANPSAITRPIPFIPAGFIVIDKQR